MEDPVKISDHIIVGGQPTAAELKELAQQGFKTIVNLRTASEEDQPLKPDEEGKLVEELGMRYLHIPVSRDNMNEQQVTEFRRQITRLPAPSFVHCATSKALGSFRHDAHRGGACHER